MKKVCEASNPYHATIAFFPQARNDKHVAIMLKLSKEGSTSYIVHRPNTGVQPRPEKLKVLLRSYEKVGDKEARN